jgi:hypothetical protein
VNAAEKLAKTIIANYDNPLQSSSIDQAAHVESLLQSLGPDGEHRYPDPDGFVVDTPMGRYTGVKEMIEMSRTPGEYKYPLTPLGLWQPSWL